MAVRVADMSVDEFRMLIQDTVAHTLTELLRDPDTTLELREDFADALHHSLATYKGDEETITADSLAASLGLSW